MFKSPSTNYVLPELIVSEKKVYFTQISKFYHWHYKKSSKLSAIWALKHHLRMTVPFVTAHHEIFHHTHHPVIPKSDLYFTFCSNLIRP